MTNEQVKASIATNLPDNTVGAITPAKLRTELNGMVDYSDTAVAADNLASAAAAFTRVVTLAANLVLTSADKQTQRITPDADRDVTLPAESGAAWTLRVMHAGSGFVLTVKRAGGTTVGVLIPGGSILVGWDGAAFWN